MKAIAVLLMLLSFSAIADCYAIGNKVSCSQPAPIQDLRNSNNSPYLVNRQYQYSGNVNSNSLDPNSISNPLGRYGSPLSPDSINNPYSNISNGR